MRIVYTGAFRFPKYDAAAARVLNNARCLRALGHEVSFISWGGKYVSEGLGTGEFDSFDGFRFAISGELDGKISIWKKILRRIDRGGVSLRILKSLPQSPDLIISYNPDLVSNVRLARYARRVSAKYANDITEWSDKKELRLVERITNAINLKCFTKKVRNRIVISDYLDSCFGGGNNVVVPPLVDLSGTKWAVARTVARSDGPLTFIYAGNPARKDCLHTVINCFQDMLSGGAELRLLIIGITKERYLEGYSELLKTSNLHGSIVFAGRVPQEEVPRYYAESDYMVLLREDDRKSKAGFPTKFVESFASGVPVVANLTSDLGRYLRDSETGFVVESNCSEALRRTLERILSLPAGRHAEIRRRVAEESHSFDFHSYTDAFSSFISNIV